LPSQPPAAKKTAPFSSSPSPPSRHDHVATFSTGCYGRHWTPVHLDIVVPDIDEAVARAERAGAVREGVVQTHGWGRIAQMADPFGHGFCVIQFLGRGYDEIAEGEPLQTDTGAAHVNPTA
jgi:hypothetical protein